MEVYSARVASQYFLRDFSGANAETAPVVKLGKASSRRDHALGVRTTTEVGCFLLDIALVLAGHLTAFWLRFYSGWATGPLFTDSLTTPTFQGYIPHFLLLS